MESPVEAIAEFLQIAEKMFFPERMVSSMIHNSTSFPRSCSPTKNSDTDSFLVRLP